MHFPDNATPEECAALVEAHNLSHGYYKCNVEDAEALLAAGLKLCDGTWQAYHRHRRRGERPCSETLKKHREKTAQTRLNKAKGVKA